MRKTIAQINASNLGIQEDQRALPKASKLFVVVFLTKCFIVAELCCPRAALIENLWNRASLTLFLEYAHIGEGFGEQNRCYISVAVSQISSSDEFTGTLPSNLFKSFEGMMDEEETRTISTQTDYVYKISLVIKGNEYNMSITSIMTSVDLSSNRFEGDIPNSIGSLSSFVLLNLSHNSFGGRIPAEIANLQPLEALDLSWNKLIGEIPGQLSSLTFLEVLNLSYNHLAGHIPIGKQFNTFPNDSYCGNPDLCGFPLSKECGNNNVSDDSPLEQDDDDDSFFASGFTWEAVVIGYGCGMTFGLLIGGLMFLLEKPKWYVNFAEDIAQQSAPKRQKKRRQRRV
ncbi:receptor-like protein 9DC3 [Solanum pennellii]|uniref:Receptor-like protein 9DC3 n=1 Tax=Solanum pennellii TaxID=28526 RepID=A0ABM1VH94_SOLPN|nr:receptor-like protein 9DC3 [Solanum pennellii]